MEFLSGEKNYRVDAFTTFRQQEPLMQPSGASIDVTGFTWASYIRAKKTDTGSPLGQFTVNTIAPATNGVIELLLTATNSGALWTAASALYTSAQAFLFLYFDVLGTASGGDTKKYLSGTIQLVATASH